MLQLYDKCKDKIIWLDNSSLEHFNLLTRSTVELSRALGGCVIIRKGLIDIITDGN
jgi:hypothetical protein